MTVDGLAKGDGPARPEPFVVSYPCGACEGKGTLDAATWGAELAIGDARGRIYLVEATGSFEDDPNLTDKKFPGNPTKSYRTREPLLVVGEIVEWIGHAPEQLQAMRDGVQRAREQGVEPIE